MWRKGVGMRFTPNVTTPHYAETQNGVGGWSRLRSIRYGSIPEPAYRRDSIGATLPHVKLTGLENMWRLSLRELLRHTCG